MADTRLAHTARKMQDSHRSSAFLFFSEAARLHARVAELEQEILSLRSCLAATPAAVQVYSPFS
jgi:hypothetical protein